MLQSRLTLIFGLLASFSVVAQDCVIQEKTTSKESGSVVEIRNVSAFVIPWGARQQKCVVNLEGYAGGKWKGAKGEFVWDGDYSEAKACGAAVELAKKNLLTGLNSSTISNVSVVVCKEKTEQERPLINPKVGTVLDNISQLRPNPKFPNSFYHKGEECKWYLETGWNGKDISQFHGIVCRYGPKQWIVVDKF